MLKYLFWTIAALFAAFLFYYREMLGYGFSQARGQFEILVKAKPVCYFLNDPELDPDMRDKLMLIESIRRFAFDSLGMSPTDNYTTLYIQPSEDIMWVVTACEPFRFNPVEWKFPFLGTFSYKGYFNRDKAERLEGELKEQGYDTNIRTAGAWSTLGWFRDPILSGMLRDNAGDLAETILHELTHGTLFVKDSLRFNENLATFFGTMGAFRFLEAHYGADSDEFQVYARSVHDRHKFAEHVLRGALYLDSLYNAIEYETEIFKKQAAKDMAIERIIQNVDTLTLFRAENYKRHIRMRNPNNSYFMSYLRYRGDYGVLEEELVNKYESDIRQMLLDYRLRFPTL